MALHCVHCGYEIVSFGGEFCPCPSCDKDPFKYEPGELLDVNPRDFWRFVKTGRLEPIEKRQ